MARERKKIDGSKRASVRARKARRGRARAKGHSSLGRRAAKEFKSGGRTCAESMLCSGLQYLDEPGELEGIGTPFAGGMRMGAHCGLYTAGLMLIGLACTGLPDGKKLAVRLQKAFTDAWEKKFPLFCRQIGAVKVRGGCRQIAETAGAELEELLRSLASDSRRTRFSRRGG